MKHFFKFFSLFPLFLCFTPIHSFVGPVIPGQPLWGITKRIGETVDVIESKVCALETDLSITGEILCSKLEDIESTVDAITACGPTVLSSSDVVAGTITLSTPGNYCLSEDVTANVTISANCVTLDLNHRCLTGVISTTGGSDDVEIKNGNITPPAPTSAPAAAITIPSSNDRVRISNVVIFCVGTNTTGVAGRDGIEVHGDQAQIFDTTIKSGRGDDDGTTGTNGGRGIFVGEFANNTVIKNCIISTGVGGDGGTTGGNGGNGISVETAVETEVTDTTILFTGNGGDGSDTRGDGGDAVFIDSDSLDTVIRNCTMRNTGAAGGGAGGGGRAGRAIQDEVTTVANLSMSYANFAHNIANTIKFNLQGLGTEQGVALANPPTATVVNSFANVFVS